MVLDSKLIFQSRFAYVYALQSILIRHNLGSYLPVNFDQKLLLLLLRNFFFNILNLSTRPWSLFQTSNLIEAK